MGFPARRFRVWSWIVLATMLFGTLAPSLAQAFAGSNAGPWSELCSSAGTKILPLERADADPSSGEGSSALRVDCPFCLAGAHAAVPPAALRIAHRAPVAAVSVPVRSAAPPPALASRPPAQPRAPPAPR